MTRPFPLWSILATLVLTVLLATGSQAIAQIGGTPKVHPHLVLEQDALAPGKSGTIALVLETAAGWHTYWSNPGVAGQATQVTWTLPHGWSVGPIQWPVPSVLPVSGLVNYGYEGAPWLLMRVSTPADGTVGAIAHLKAAVSWLVCREVCIPESASLSLSVPIGAISTTTPNKDRSFTAARAKLPVVSPWPSRYRLSRSLDVLLASPTLADAGVKDATFFPARTGVIDPNAPQILHRTAEGPLLRLKPAATLKGHALIAGVLSLTAQDGSVSAFSIQASPGTIPNVTTAYSGMTLTLAFLLAFAGGVILNVMPCVLPVLAMKAMAFASLERVPAYVRRDGLAYALGAIVSFLAFGALVVGLRETGNVVGWGFQLQQPLVVAFFSLLFFLVGLNFSGGFDLPALGVGSRLAARQDVAGPFFTGVLAVTVAAPCTAPFMAIALGYALTQSAPSALLVFLGLGLGFSLPFLILALFPGMIAHVPRPGRWMIVLKQALAFPMYGAAAWLVWVLAQQSGVNAVAIILVAMTSLAFALWSWDALRPLGMRGRAWGAITFLLGILVALSALALLPGATAARTKQIQVESAFTPARLAALRASGKPVFVNVTAAWCITCLVNEKAVLSRAEVKKIFHQNDVTYLTADWTTRNADITNLLTINGRSGVPLYLFYPADAERPIVFQQILTVGAIADAVRRK